MGSNFTLETDRKDVLSHPGKKYFLMNSICMVVYGRGRSKFCHLCSNSKTFAVFSNNLQFFCFSYWILIFFVEIHFQEKFKIQT